MAEHNQKINARDIKDRSDSLNGVRINSAQYHYIIPLIIIVFALGFLTARLMFVETDTSSLSTTSPPHAVTPVPATPSKPGTPTPNAQTNADQVPTLYIDIAPDDFDLIKAKRQQALEDWILIATNEDYVPATIRMGTSNPLRARLRLKGDWADHFFGNKWSYRVQLLDDQTLLGMRVFSVQAPPTRSYLNEWLFLENLRNEDVLAVRYSFVNVVENGEDKGVYALEEAFSKELFESLGRREGVIIRYNEDLLWRYWAGFDNDLSTPRGVMDFYIIDDFQTNKILSDTVLSQQRQTAVGQLRGWWQGKLASSDVFDAETTAKFLALTDLWGAGHALQWHNLRYYFNPITTKLEPVVFDAQPLEEGTWVELSQLKGIRQTVQLNDPHVQRFYVQSLRKYSSPLYLEELQSTFDTSFSINQAALMPEYGSKVNDEGKNVLAEPWDDLEVRQQALRELLNPLQMAYAYLQADSQPNLLQIQVGNLLDLPVEIVGVRVNNTFIPGTADWLSVESSNLFLDKSTAENALILKPLELDAEYMHYAKLNIPGGLLSDGELAQYPLQIETRIWGLSETITQPVISAYPDAYVEPVLPEVSDIDEVLSTHHFLILDEKTRMLVVQPGEWEIEQDLILPKDYGLQVLAGTKLLFGSGVVLLSHGPLQFQGTKQAPIQLGPIDDAWSGIVVLNADSSSHWSYTIIQGTNAVSRQGWILTGGVTFYNSPVDISHCVFQNSIGEDALNIVRTQFTIEETTFQSTKFDAFDGDFSQGSIKNSRFYNITSDGIDISGSDVVVESIDMHTIGDKGISVGESSRLSGFDIVIEQAAFGIVSKDNSQTELSQITLDDIGTAGFAAYIKKPEYGPASISVHLVDFRGVAPEKYTLVQTGSWIDLEQERIWGSDIDVDALYNP